MLAAAQLSLFYFLDTQHLSLTVFIFTSEALYFLLLCSLGLFRSDIAHASHKGWWHLSLEPQLKDALEGQCCWQRPWAG